LVAYAVVVVEFAGPVNLSAIHEPARVQPSMRWQRPERSEFRVGPGGVIEHADDLNGYLQGRLHTDLRNPPTFVVEAAGHATLKVKVRAVATLGARLVVKVDGLQTASVDLPDRDGKNDGDVPEYDRELAFTIPAGRRRMTLDNTGGDWLTVAWVEWLGRFR
jgi:hypothetical protein